MSDPRDDEPDYVPLGEYDRRHSRRLGHSPFIVNGRPADLQPLPTIDPLKWEAKAIPERRWIVPGLIPEGNVTMFGGDGGLGKSQLALQLLASTALGRPWLGRQVRRCKSIGLFCEDDPDELHRRLAAILNHYDAGFADLEDLRLVCRVDQENLLLEFRDQWGAGEPTALYTRLQNLVTEHGAELLVLDSLHDLFGGNENSRQQARQFVGSLRSIALSMDGAVLLTAHPSLSGRNSGTGEAGSTAWNNAVRSRLYLTAPQAEDDEDGPGRDYRELRNKKANYGAAGDVIRMRWQAGVFLVDGAEKSPTNVVDKIDFDTRVLEEMRAMISGGGVFPTNWNAPQGFANAIRKRPGWPRYHQKMIVAAQERLLKEGRAVSVPIKTSSRPRPCIRPADMRYPGEEKGE